MNRLNHKGLISRGFYLALIMLAAVSAYSYCHMRHLIHSNELTARSQKVQEELDHVLVNLLDIESGQRGCLLAGDLCFLEPSQHALDNIPLRLKVLRELTGDQPQTQRLLDTMEPLIAQKMALLQKRISWLEKGDREAAIRSIRSGEGLKLMQNIRTVISAINAEEDRLLAVRQAAAQASNRNALLTLLIGTCISFGLLLLIFSCLKREITQRRCTEEKLSRSEEEFRAVVNNMPTVVFKGYLDGSVGFFDDKVETLTGYPRGDFDSRRLKWTDLILAEDKGIAKQVFIKALNNFGSYVREYRISTKEGEVIWIQERSQINFDQKGQADSVSGVFFDITVRKRGEEAARESEKNYRNLFDNAVEGVFQSSPEGRFLIVNPAFARMLGYASPQEMITEVTNIGQQLWVHPEMREEMKKLLLEHGSVCDYEILYRRRDGTPMWFSENIRLAMGADGQEFYEGFMVDITERKRAEENLLKEKALSENIINSLPAVFYLFDKTGRFLRWNTNFEQVTGYTGEEFARLSPLDLFDNEGKTVIEESIQEVFLKGENTAEADLILKDGGRIPYFFTGRSTDLNDTQCLIGMGIDITESKRTEELLKESEEKYRTLFESSSEGIFVLKDVFLDCNEQACRLWACQREDIIGHSPAEFSPPRQPDGRSSEAAAREWIQKAISGEPQFFYWQHRRKDGVLIDTEISLIAVTVTGRLLVQATLRDISDRKQAEAEIKLNETRMASLVKIAHYDSESIQDLLDFALDEAIALTGSKIGYIYLYDDETRQFTLNTWSKDVMKECTIAEPQTIYQLEKTGIWGEVVRQARPIMVNDFPAPHPLKKGYPEGHTELHKFLTIPVLSGERIVAVTAVANKATDYDQADVRQLTLMMDAVWKITARRQAEEALRFLNLELELRVQERTAQLEAANRELEAFSYSVSHDLRAPLRGIDGWTMAFLEDYGEGLNDQGRDYLDWVRAETQHMGRLIDDMLSLSRVSRAEMRREPVDLTALVQDIADKLQKIEPERQAEFILQPGLTATGDPLLLEMALFNLLENAWKFTGKQPATVIEFGRMKQDDQPVFFIRDNGTGFDMAYASNLFGAFQRLHQASEFPGTGIGLATVQRIINRHDGRIWAEAAVDHGATFYFTL
jgi:PAS domain S-box-containing protein